MTKRSPKRVQQILRKAPSLKHLLREADADHNRLIQLRQILPAELASHCIDTHLRNGRLVIYVNSPVWASRLRLMTPKIQESFQARKVLRRRVSGYSVWSGIPKEEPGVGCHWAFIEDGPLAGAHGLVAPFVAQ